MGKYQDLSQYSVPKGFRGKNAFVVQLWWIVQSLLFNTSPQFMYGWRRWLLRLFGCNVGKGVILRPSVKTTYPWKVSIGDRAQIGDDVCLYSLGEISIGSDSVVSQRTYVCAGDHDHQASTFDLRAQPIRIGNEVWVGADCFVGPGVRIADGAVVGARSGVFMDLPAGMICLGTPCKPIKQRQMKS